MARYLFGGNDQGFEFVRRGAYFAPPVGAEKTLTAWDSPTGSQITDLATNADGTGPITQVVTDDKGRWAFYGPDGVTSLYLKSADGSFTLVESRVNRAELSATYEALGVPGAKADYTGRLASPGTGTDNRAAIQAALNAASSLSGSGYYAFQTRRSRVVKLAPGDYYVSDPGTGNPALIVPAGVTFDFTAATLYVDYPATASENWAAIKVEQYGNVRVGKLFQSSKVAAPDTYSKYDAIRVVLTDNHSKVVGYADSEINGFQGAACRFIGAWINYFQGIRVTSCDYAVIGSHYGTAFNYVDSGGTQPAAGSRYVTDVFVDDCAIINCQKGGVIMGAAGNTGDINALSFLGAAIFETSRTKYENIGGYVFDINGMSRASIRDCGIEECGLAGNAIMNFATVRLVTIDNLQFNLSGRSIKRYDGTTGVVTSTEFIRFNGVNRFRLDGLYYYNGLNTLNFGRTAAPAYMDIRNVRPEVNAFGTGGTVDPALLGLGYREASLASGEETIDRRFATGSNLPFGSGNLRLTYFRARKTETITQAAITSGNTAAGATPTLVRVGIYSVNPATGDLTLVASTPSDTTLLAGTFTRYTKALSASFSKQAGARYAIGVLVVSAAAAPTLVGAWSQVAAVSALQAPTIGATLSGQTDLPASITAASLTGSGLMAYGELLP